ncbi:hypothetical protein TWF506_004982 [Arthrobotrys conoides]|uniref:Uncharacterized protein n=1 Tax=Arthrobotrys conoides TaxID=74498 RepID=A0AAN8NDF1_9PEZI
MNNNSTNNTEAPTCLPLIPIPIDTSPRMEYLRKLLERPQEITTHIENIRAVLKAYEDGETPSRFYQNGQPVGLDEVDLEIPVWFEGGHMFTSVGSYVPRGAHMAVS